MAVVLWIYTYSNEMLTRLLKRVEFHNRFSRLFSTTNFAGLRRSRTLYAYSPNSFIALPDMRIARPARACA